MSEKFEEELRSALRSGVSDELSAAGLAEGARSRLRRRRRTTSAIVGAAVIVAAVPIGLAAIHAGGTGGGRTPVVVENAGADGLRADWHWEAFRGVEIGVPDSWQPGALDQWCVGGGLDRSRSIQRPDTVQTLVYCESPTHGYGVQFGAEGAPKGPGQVWQYTQGNTYPHNAWLANLESGPAQVLVVAPDRETAQNMADSFRSTGATDATGCPAQQKVPKLGSAPALSPLGDGSMVLCEYSGTDGSLVRAKALGSERSAKLVDALRSPGEGGAMRDCAAIDPNGRLVLQGGRQVAWAFDTGCSDSGVDLGGGTTLPWTDAIAANVQIFAPPPAPPVAGNPDGSVSNDGTVVDNPSGATTEVPPDQGGGSGSSGSSGTTRG